MDILFAHLLADMVREAAVQQPPDNLFVLPEGLLAWKRLFKLLQDEHEVVSMEISDSRQQTSREVRPHFVRMARNFEDKGIPFIRVPITSGCTHRELRADLGGIEYSPTILNLSFLEEGKMTMQKFEGYQEIVQAFNSGRYRRTVEDWAEKKVKRKIAEKMAEELATGLAGAMAGAAKEREERLRREYEEKLRKQREELKAKEELAQKEREKREQEEKLRREEEERRVFAEGKSRVEEKRRREAEVREKRAELLPKLKSMKLNDVPTREIKQMMTEMGISVVGLLNRDDFLERLFGEFPELRNSGEKSRYRSSSSGKYSDSDLFFGESVVDRISNAKLESLTFGELKQLLIDAGYDPTTYGSCDEMRRTLRHYANEAKQGSKISGDSTETEERYMAVKLERDALERRVGEKDAEIQKLKKRVDQLKSDLDVEKRRTNQQPQPRDPLKFPDRMRTKTGDDVRPKDRVQQLETERLRIQQDLFNMRILYSTTLDDYNIIDLVSQGDDGVVLKVKCTREQLTDRDKVYALKVLTNYHATMTMSRARDAFKTEYEVLCKLPLHDNIIKLHAFFFDRFDPKIHPAIMEHPGSRSVSLFLIMELHPTSMDKVMEERYRQRGPKKEDVLNWFTQLVNALNFLNDHCVVHRDMKLSNMLLAANNVLKIADFGTAVQLERHMSIPFFQGMQIPGNNLHQSPEILNARPGANRYLYYDRYSVWVAGTLAFELAGHQNPFLSGQLDQRGYSSAELPRLAYTSCRDQMQAVKLPDRFTDLVHQMLEFDRERRMKISDVYWEMQAITL